MPAPGWPRTLGNAAFLAVSWTWCIGMYLPVLLLRDFGPWSLAAFAVPNCVGAMAMGVMLHRRDAAARLIAHHERACRAFSLVTVAFQMWFLAMLLMQGPVRGYALAGAGAGLVWVMGMMRRRTAAAVLAVAISVALVIWWGAGPHEALRFEPPLVAMSGWRWAGLWAVCGVGFAFCPYLDLTFLAMRHGNPGLPGTRSFLVGFLVVFPIMIALTAWYGLAAVRANPVEPWLALAPLIVLHISFQLAITIGLHMFVLAAPTPAGPRRPLSGPLLGALGVALLLALAVNTVSEYTYRGLHLHDLTYRAFMGFYGLVFPAYVVVCVLGPSGLRTAPTRREWWAFAAAVFVGLPGLWAGFMERRPEWLLLSVGAVLLAKVATTPAPAR